MKVFIRTFFFALFHPIARTEQSKTHTATRKAERNRETHVAREGIKRIRKRCRKACAAGTQTHRQVRPAICLHSAQNRCFPWNEVVPSEPDIVYRTRERAEDRAAESFCGQEEASSPVAKQSPREALLCFAVGYHQLGSFSVSFSLACDPSERAR